MASDLWIQREALQAGEDRYGLEALACDEETFVRLNPVLAAQYDPEAQTVRFEPQPDLLPTYTQSVKLPVLAEPEGLPVYALDYGLNVHYQPQSGVNQSGSLNGSYAYGKFSAQVGVAESSSPGRALTVDPSASARYQLSPTAHVEAGWNIAPILTTSLDGFSGVQARVTGVNLRYLDVFTVDLPLPATVRLVAGGAYLGEWTFGAGRVQFRSVPLPGSSGAVSAVIEDASGRREVGQNYSFPSAVLPGAGYSALAEAGLLDQVPYANGRVSYGLTDSLTLDAQFGVRASRPTGAISVTAASQTQAFTVGYLHNLYGLTDAATLDYRGRLGAVGLGLAAQVPLQDPRQLRGEAVLGYDLGGFATGLAVGYDQRQAGWYGRAQITGQLNPTLRLSAMGKISEQTKQFTVTLGYKPSEQWDAQVGTSVGAAGPSVRAAARYAPTPDQSVRMLYSSGVLYGEYRRRGLADYAVGAATTGQVDASIQGALVYANNRIYASAARTSDVTVLLDTGVPGLAVYAGGTYQGRTDASGALTFSIPAGAQIDLRVDPKALPIEIGMREAHLVLSGTASRSIKVDWRSNFQRLRFVSFQLADGQEAAYGTVSLEGGDRYGLDAFGTVVLPAAAQPLSGILTLRDGRSCPVTIGVQDEVVSCP
ncbi:TonB-dependent receptor [Deinococcus aerophilus]|uniref:TonB-dependent receptor n=1 Tax=Deinococcus aerophilus TaxID=522488 RepID=UPI00166E62B6|nr:TonB-dependent receptor [Deinococcus aerophilus]